MALEEMAVEYVLETREKAPGMGGKKLWHMYKREFKEGTPLAVSYTHLTLPTNREVEISVES